MQKSAYWLENIYIYICIYTGRLTAYNWLVWNSGPIHFWSCDYCWWTSNERLIIKGPMCLMII